MARAAIAPVASVSAGPPCGGLYLNPPSRGGLCDGVTTIPSARPAGLPRLCRRMAWLTAGVGVYRSRESMATTTLLATNTSSALVHAGSERAWVSRPMNNGPLIPCAFRYSTIAAVVATICASLKAASRLDPRCPDVPNATWWATFAGSGSIA
ncbi:Uncharacterised protein [Mycobacteroides abscessus subsp. abscessus]|nr:Uncharacterised protein [Mycobacteroides abscessus subsp. abscessus]